MITTLRRNRRSGGQHRPEPRRHAEPGAAGEAHDPKSATRALALSKLLEQVNAPLLAVAAAATLTAPRLEALAKGYAPIDGALAMHLESALDLPPNCLDSGEPLSAAQLQKLRDRLKSPGQPELRDGAWPESAAAAAQGAAPSAKPEAAPNASPAATNAPPSVKVAATSKQSRKRATKAASAEVPREAVLDALRTANRQAYGPRVVSPEDAQLNELRRGNLANAVQARGAKRFLANELKVNPSRISLYLDRAKIPPEFLRDAERVLRLQPGWLDAEVDLPALSAVSEHVTQLVGGADVKVLELPKGAKVPKLRPAAAVQGKRNPPDAATAGEASAAQAPAKDAPAPAPAPAAAPAPTSAPAARPAATLVPSAGGAAAAPAPEALTEPAGEAAHVLRRLHAKLDVALNRGALSAEQAWELLDQVDSILEMKIEMAR